MKKTMKTTNSSLLYRKIDELGLKGNARSEAMGALESADRLADTIYWVFEKLGQITRLLTPNSNLKHQ